MSQQHMGDRRMNHSIEQISQTPWQGQLHRHPIDGKRRIMVWASALHRLIQSPQAFEDFKKIVTESPLRNEIDYHVQPNRNDIRLTISAVQAVLVLDNSPTSWQLHHALCDLIHRGFSNTEGSKSHANHH
jgi:hypothetical protein